MGSVPSTPFVEHTDDLTTTDTAAGLRHRAGQLIELAAQIERSCVMSIPDLADSSAWSSSRARLCDVLLERNLHQLHQAADDLRHTAFEFIERAGELSPGVCSAA